MRRAFVALICVVLLAGGAGRAHAHASLISATPADGAMIATAPDHATLRFNEPVTPIVLRLIALDGHATVLEPKAHDAVVEVALPPLDIGTHVLSWRVTSADGHPVGGALLFSVGRISGAQDANTATPVGLAAAIVITRVALSVGLFFGVGGVFFRAWIGELPDTAIPVLRAGLRLGLAVLIPALALQGTDLLGASLSAVAGLALWRTAAATSFAATLVLAAIALLAALLATWLSRAQRPLSILALVAVASALAASGHASTASPQAIMRPTVWLHAACVALWAGSLWPLSRALALNHAPQALTRFTNRIPLPFLVLIASGFVLAVVQIGHLADLPGTAYGQVFMAKLVLVGAVMVIAIYNRVALTPAAIRGDVAAADRLRHMIGIEIALVFAILAVVALWRFTPPPRTLTTAEPAFVHIHDVRAMADLTLTPGQSGALSATINLMREDFTPLPAREVELALSNPTAGIEPIIRQATRDADGVWRIENLVLPASGRWEASVGILISDFERLRLDAPVIVNKGR